MNDPLSAAQSDVVEAIAPDDRSGHADPQDPNNLTCKLHLQTMKLSLRTFQVRQTADLLRDIEKQLASLQDLVPITTAHVLVGKYRDQNPPFCVAVHLEVPGPDIHVAGRDHTLAAAFQKVRAELRHQIMLRQAHRQQQWKTRLKMRRDPVSF